MFGSVMDSIINYVKLRKFFTLKIYCIQHENCLTFKQYVRRLLYSSQRQQYSTADNRQQIKALIGLSSFQIGGLLENGSLQCFVPRKLGNFSMVRNWTHLSLITILAKGTANFSQQSYTDHFTLFYTHIRYDAILPGVD